MIITLNNVSSEGDYTNFIYKKSDKNVKIK